MKNMSRFCSIILAIMLTISASCLSGYALVPGEDTHLTSAEYLTEDEVLLIAETQISGYISSEISNAKETVTPTNNFIAVYDLYDNIFAYVVPLMHKDDGEIGYIVVGALRNGFKTYSINLNPGCLDELRAMLTNELIVKNNQQSNVAFASFDIPSDPFVSETTNINLEDSSTALILIPPMTWLIKVDSSDTKYYAISGNDTYAYDVSSVVEENLSEISSAYSLVLSDAHGEEIARLLSSEDSTVSANNISTTSSTSSTEDVRLSCEWVNTSSFVPILYQNKYYYGGDQNWWGDASNLSDYGCGPVAAANITYYLAETNSTYSNLYDFSSLTYNNFYTHMTRMYTTMDPSILGVFSYTTWAEKVKEFGLNRGVTLTYTSRGAYNSNSAYQSSYQAASAAFIKAGLNRDCPVAALNTYIFDYDFGRHWITITKYFSNDSGSWIALSSWGTRYSLDFDTYYSYMFCSSGSGFVYFLI